MTMSMEAGVPPPNHLNKITYFHCSLIGYFFGNNANYYTNNYETNLVINLSWNLRFADGDGIIGSIQSGAARPAVSGTIYAAATVHYGLY